MQSSRDSSVLRSLAIAFGDGLAFGVGMKLTQPGVRPAAALVPASNEQPVLSRINEIERRIEKVEKIPPALMAGASGQPFDAKVLEAVVGALDARLLEQATQTERRLKDLEAKFTLELKTLHAQDHSVSTGLQSRLGELHEQFSGQIGELRQQSETARVAYRTELAALHRQFAIETAKMVEAALASKDAEFQQRTQALTSAVEEHARAISVRHQTLESRSAAHYADTVRLLEDARAAMAAESERVVDQRVEKNLAHAALQISQLRGVFDRHAQLAAERQHRIEEIVAAHGADLSQRLDEAIAYSKSETNRELAELRAAVEQQMGAAAAREAGIAAHWEGRVAAMHSEITAVASRLVQERVARAIEEQVLPLRSQIEAKEQELLQLRQKLSDSDRNAANMILAIGQACREAAERIAPTTSGAPPEPAKAESVDPPAEAPVAASGSDEGLPGFVQTKPPGKLLRIPLVSAMTLAIAASAALLHYL